MDYLSSPSNSSVDNICFSGELNFKTPKDKKPSFYSSSPIFAPFSVSSPVKSDWRMNNYRGGRNNRYFNTSDSGINHSASFNSPFYKNRRGRNNFGRGNHRNNRPSGETPIYLYVDASMTEDPWLELENELGQKEKNVDCSVRKPISVNLSDTDDKVSGLSNDPD